MKEFLFIVLCFWLTVSYSQFGQSTSLERGNQSDPFQERPEFYVLEWKNGTKLTEIGIGILIEIDSIGLQEVNLLNDNDENPVLYVSEISTPVCADGNCRLMDIKLYWTLLGDYAGFDKFSKLPLTKHDHDEFLSEDYEKLHQLLMDDNSILKQRTIDELVEKPIRKNLEMEADGLSGATVTEIKESVVSGALYSCYAAWHIVHGEIKGQLKAHTQSILSLKILEEMLNSNHPKYQLFALNELNEDLLRNYYKRISKIFETGIPLVRTFILKKLPNDFWGDGELQNPYWDVFGKIDINSRSLLLDHLEDASNKVLESISVKLGFMTKNQLKSYLSHLENIKGVSPKINDNLRSFAQSKNEVNAYLVEEFLEEYEVK